MNDNERKKQPISSVSVSVTDEGEELYSVGLGDVTAITWGETCGSMAALLTVQVWKGERLHSEHPFINCLGVYYAETPDA